MAIDFNTFVDWAQSKFSSVKIAGNEVKVNSIFTDDNGNHLWCNPSGGKNLIRYGCYHCWKTEKKGTLVHLVMQVEKCDKRKAMEILGLAEQIIIAPDDIDFDISFGGQNTSFDYSSIQNKTIELPPHCYFINQAPISWYNRSINYLNQRKLKSDNLFVCTAGKYEGRIIIPYYSAHGNLIYFNGRTIIGSNLRYRGPEKEIGVGKEDVLFFTNYPNFGDKIYLCEGEFDAMTLGSLGLNAVACGGKNLSDKQAIMLSPYKICLALDADDAGKNALNIMHNKLLQFGTNHAITVVSPPKALKDWNNFYCEHDSNLLLAYINRNESKFEVL